MSEQTVFVVDDDEAMRNSLKWLIGSVGLNAEAFESAGEFIENYYPGRSGCMVLDVRMPGMSGLELLEKLSEDKIGMPVIMLTGHGDVPMAVRAMKAGAVDFLEKPCNDQELLDCIQHALMEDHDKQGQHAKRAEIKSCVSQLTARELDVLKMVVAGHANREIASRLGVSTRTVEVHRAKVMEKMKADSLAQLVRMAILVGLVED